MERNTLDDGVVRERDVAFASADEERAQ